MYMGTHCVPDSVNVEEFKSPSLSFLPENSSPELFNIYRRDASAPEVVRHGALIPFVISAFFLSRRAPVLLDYAAGCSDNSLLAVV